ncbi:MAG: glycosyltransferase [Oscillospiraceae bacterium]|nr:glycosyltransferase [Bacteroidales bacterium]MBQ8726963.1 glycosyltransferase [Oscillospiraceae bacterium]MBR5822868.1 glycosyltransferase [Paludibacteraceae bacterium]
MKDAKVSIILPVYNAKEYIKDCIDSILAQTYQNFELIIGDDASTDNSIDICKQYDNPKIRIIKCEHNYIRTCNTLLKFCNGDYIARMDADDIMLPNRIQKQVEILEKDKSLSLCCSNRLIIGTDERRDMWVENYVDDFILRLFCGNFIPHSTVMIRTSFLRNLGIKYKSEYPYAEDYKMWSDIAMNGGTIYAIKEPLIKYRIHDSSISMQNMLKQKETATKIQNEIYNYLIEKVIPYKDLYLKLNEILQELKNNNVISDLFIRLFFSDLFKKFIK